MRAQRQLVRVLTLLSLLVECRGRVSLEYLASLHGCNVRTIRRDLEALEACGALIEYSGAQGAGEKSMVRFRWDAARRIVRAA